MLTAKPDGSVFRDGAQITVWVNSNGYLTCKYKQKPVVVHRLIAQTFIPNPGELSDVNHKNGNKLDNRVENLEWCSRSDNLYHALRNGLHAKTETPILGINTSTGDTIRFESQAAAKAAGFTQANINKVLRGKRKHHKGYIWEYA